MAKNEQPVFTRTPVLGRAALSLANPNRDGTGTIVSVISGLTDGVRIDQIEVIATATTTAGMIRLFLSQNGGANWFLWREIIVTAIVPSGVVAAFREVIDLSAALDDPPLNLADTQMVLGAATQNAETFNVFARGGSYAS
jgi:hypothetical protein